VSKSDASSLPRAADGRVPGRRGLATRQKLLDCTADLLRTTPYRDLKITDITRAAGTSPATFYQYFVDLQEVVLAVAEDTAAEGRRIAELIEGQQWKGAAGVRSAENLVDGFLEFWRAHRPTLRVVELLTSEGDERFRDLRNQMLNATTRALAAAIESVRAGNGKNGVDPMAMAGALVGMMANLAAHRAGFEAWDIPMTEVREAMVRLVYWGVSGPRLPGR
jgi:AcrR family transcriptional regulator